MRMRMRWLEWLAAGLVAITATWAGAAYSQSAQAPPAPGGGPMVRERTIVVTGEGTVDVTPDRATVALSVIVQRPTARDAQQQSASTMAQIVRAIVAAGIPQTEIRTSTVSLYPQHRPESGGTGPIVGYQAVNRVVVTVDDISRVGQVIDAGVGAGADGVDSLNWSLRDPTASRAQALRIAVQNAQATANAIASAAGVGGVRLVRIEQTSAFVYPRQAVGVIQAAPATPVLPGTMPVDAQVRAVFAF
ncbi:MAG TPA: SIMPL domain-containing protein [bacterium]|nr:SIMPL domain-containing protein [bacterium]